jgi:hypothetical protein
MAEEVPATVNLNGFIAYWRSQGVIPVQIPEHRARRLLDLIDWSDWRPEPVRSEEFQTPVTEWLPRPNSGLAEYQREITDSILDSLRIVPVPESGPRYMTDAELFDRIAMEMTRDRREATMGTAIEDIGPGESGLLIIEDETRLTRSSRKLQVPCG